LLSTLPVHPLNIKMSFMGVKVVANNRKARFEYFLLEHFEAGISLQGSEIKSIRAGQMSLQEAYININEDHLEAWLMGAHIAPYEAASRFNHDPLRPRRLLLHKNEIREMWQSVRQKGVTIVPVQVYLKEGRAKIELAIAKGKKLYDKREEIAKRDEQREMAREARGRRDR
jgi:SsrA-binding protein